MCEPIPAIICDLYRYFSVGPDPKLWPDYLQDDPVNGHGLYSFYLGIQMGLQIAAAGLETV